MVEYTTLYDPELEILADDIGRRIGMLREQFIQLEQAVRQGMTDEEDFFRMEMLRDELNSSVMLMENLQLSIKAVIRECRQGSAIIEEYVSEMESEMIF